MEDQGNNSDEPTLELRQLTNRVAALEGALERSRKSESELRQMRAIIDSAADAIITQDLRGTVNSWNLAGENIFGYSADEIIGSSVESLIPQERLEEFYIVLDRIKNGERVDHFETVRKRKDGSSVHVSLTVSPIISSTGEVIGASTIARDVSLRIQQEHDYRRQNLQLENRCRELECLYNISYLIDALSPSIGDILKGAVELLPPAWQYPEIACARIRFEHLEFTTEGFKETPWNQDGDIIVDGKIAGNVEVFYTEQRPKSDEGPFLTEERRLLDCICERFGRLIERILAKQSDFSRYRPVDDR